MIEIPKLKEDATRRERALEERIKRELFHYQAPYTRGFRDGWDLRLVNVQGEVNARFRQLEQTLALKEKEIEKLNKKLLKADLYYQQLKRNSERAVSRLNSELNWRRKRDKC